MNMTKEELKKEAEVYSYKLYHSKAWNPGEDMLVKAYLAGAEPREKQIAELSKHIVELQNDKGELIDRVKELEAQIEKMKCCQNCRKFNNLSYDCTCAEVCNEWELRND